EKEVLADPKTVKDQLQVRTGCRKFARKFINIQREQFKRLGIFGHWDTPYLTMDKWYESEILKNFGKLVEKGYIYRGLRPIHWCINCVTALAISEIEYQEKESYSIWIRFPLHHDPKKVFSNLDNLYALVWTTTPWTIPANLALAFNPDMEYGIYKVNNTHYLFLTQLAESIEDELDLKEIDLLRTISGEELEGTVFRHPIFDRDSVGILGEFVTAETGSGVVHIAPGHGEEDFEVGKRYGLEFLCPVDEHGRFTAEAHQFQGLDLNEGNEAVLKALKEKNNLLKVGKISHPYPFCWRCHQPVVFRTTTQWFMNVDHDSHREKSLVEIEKVRWVPKDSLNRMYSAVATRPDWCLSRQRFWGVAIPAFYCRNCQEPILRADWIKEIAELVAREGADVWYQEPFPLRFVCPKCGSDNLRRETDILDVWFDSGCSYLAVSDHYQDLSWPCELYLEGSDQHRGWFNQSLMVSMATRNEAPYRQVLTHGFVLDKDGRGMHKSLGNFVLAMESVEKYGAEILRLWVASSDYTQDVRYSDEIMARIVEAYRKFRNTFRFMLANLSNFDPEKEKVDYNELGLFDRYIEDRLSNIIEEVNQYYENYEFYKIYHSLYRFAINDLSSFYFDIIKDRLYTWKKDSKGRRSTQTVLYDLLVNLTRIMAPILSFTCEEVWQNFGRETSIFLAGFPTSGLMRLTNEELTRCRLFLSVRDTVLKRLELLRQEGTVGSSLESEVILYSEDKDTMQVLEKNISILPELFIVSRVKIDKDHLGPNAIVDTSTRVIVDAVKADGEKCQRCWIYSDKLIDGVCSKCQEVMANEKK
ncbi:MAG TPA: isoleucine--tRNA ligase, partial [bacterium (Candidatus Stahlbacteria)]|nr:isoleucine--tRNA ligase [Candidatus Stahlbacteria bacterium]